MSLPTPIIRIENRFRFNIELSAQSFDQRLCSCYLAVGGRGRFAVSYQADTDCAIAAIPCSSGDDGPLSLPFFGGLDLTVTAAEPVI